MSPRALPALGLLLAGCAAPLAVPLGPDHPASADAPVLPLLVDAAPPPPAAQPDLPAPLRPSPHDGVDHGPKRPGVGHVETSSAPTYSDAAIRPVLDAYLAVHDALAADRTAPEAAAALAEAVRQWTAVPPPGDAHFWHGRADDASALQASARALASADGVEAAREAFGAFGVPFARTVEATGVPEGYRLDRFTCGMADVEAGGVWLQPAGDAENPFFGTSMALCGTRQGAAPSAADAAPVSHDGAHR